LDYLVVRQTHGHKSASGCRQRDKLDQNLGGGIGLLGSQTDRRAQNPAVDVGSGNGRHKPSLHAPQWDESG
jgi:hypothetical protein